MKSGLLWYDNSTKTITQKIEEAAKRYNEKFGSPPDRCYINANDIPSGNPENLPVIATHSGIEIASSKTIMPNYVWLGIAEEGIHAVKELEL